MLDDGVTSDRFFNFVVTGYSLIDWIKNDPAVPLAAKTDSEIRGLHRDRWLAICGDVATAAKHFSLSRRTPIASGVTATRGFGEGRFGKGMFGKGEGQIVIHLPDGSNHGFLELVHGVMYAWIAFFERHAISIN